MTKFFVKAVRSAADFEAAFSTAVKERSDGILVMSSPLFGALRQVALAAKTKLPAIYEGHRTRAAFDLNQPGRV